MTKERKLILRLILAVVIIGVVAGFFVTGYFFSKFKSSNSLADNPTITPNIPGFTPSPSEIGEGSVSPSLSDTPVPTATPIPAVSSKPYPTTDQTPYAGDNIIVQNVPFILQAPLNEWSNPVFQNACEEASVIMADKWVNGQTAAISRPDARQQILDITNWEDSHMGGTEDLNAQDTASLMRNYFNYQNVTVQNNITADNIIAELQKGNIIIVPVNGQALNNIHFTQPGPLEHMELIKGYDFTTNQFIVNDTGIGVGNSYRYGKDLFFNAIREYPTGNHLPITGNAKVMIVISK